MDSKVEARIADICEIWQSVMGCLKSEIGMGVMNADTDEVGKVVDIVNDLARTEKYLRESQYYCKVTEAMEERGNEFYGYNYPRVSGNLSRGYKPMVDQEPYISGYLHDPDFNERMSEYGKPYTNYMDAKRHYTQTGSASDKVDMDMYAKRHLDQSIASFKDIWGDASPELKQKMKTDLKNLIDNV